MALAPGNHFKADLRAIRFTLWDHLGTERLFKLERFAHLSRDECDAVIDQAYRFATEVTGPAQLDGRSDRLPHGGRPCGHAAGLPRGVAEALRGGADAVHHSGGEWRLRRPLGGRRGAAGAAERRQHRVPDVSGAHARRRRPDGALRPRPRTASASCRRCSTAASPGPCACRSRTPAPTSAPLARARVTSRATSTRSPAPSAGSRRAITT